MSRRPRLACKWSLFESGKRRGSNVASSQPTAMLAGLIPSEMLPRSTFEPLDLHARVALCGLISGYNEGAAPVAGSRDAFGSLLIKRATLQGFIVLDHYDKLARVSGQLAEWKLVVRVGS